MTATPLKTTEDKNFHTEEMVLSMGPQHPSTHGVLRFEVHTDGEIMSKAVPDIGYLHRGIEKIAEKVGWHGFMPYTDRIDYVAAMTANEGYAAAVEKLAGIEVPKRAHYLRVIASELNRISSHLVGVGALTLDLGAATPFAAFGGAAGDYLEYEGVGVFGHRAYAVWADNANFTATGATANPHGPTTSDADVTVFQHKP